LLLESDLAFPPAAYAPPPPNMPPHTDLPKDVILEVAASLILLYEGSEEAALGCCGGWPRCYCSFWALFERFGVTEDIYPGTR